MKRLILIALLLSAAQGYAQSALKTSGNLSVACTNATTTCDGTSGSQLKLPVGEYSIASITVHGTFSGATLFFEFSDDGGTNWYPSACTRNDTATQETSEAIADNTNRSWDCGTGGASMYRIRLNAITSGTVLINATQSAIQIEPAPTVSLSTANGNQPTIKNASTAPVATDTALVVAQAPNGNNPCVNPSATLTSATVTTSGTSAVQVVALSGSTKIYVCSLTVIGQSGTTPTFSLVAGTGSNCATGQAVAVAAFATPANTLFQFANPVAVGPSGAALCYLDTGTTPVQSATLTYVQQ